MKPVRYFLFSLILSWGFSASSQESASVVPSEPFAATDIQSVQEVPPAEVAPLPAPGKRGAQVTDALSPEAPGKFLPEAEELRLQQEDLKAQRKMADAAWVMVFTTAVQIALGLISVAALFVTLRETRKATRATEESAQVAREAYLAEHRPWLTVHPVGESPRGWTISECEFSHKYRIANLTKTPATDVKIKAWIVQDWKNLDLDSETLNQQDNNLELLSDLPVVEQSHEHLLVLQTPDFNLETPISWALIVCVYYRSPHARQKLSRTAFVREIFSATPNKRGYAIFTERGHSEFSIGMTNIAPLMD